MSSFDGTPAVTPDDILVIDGPEQSTIKDPPDLADAGLPPVVGAQAWQVFRATRGAPEQADGLGYTYNHHVDIAVWHGRYYVAWNSCERDEDVWPSRELYSTSADGAAWDPPRELFPQGVSTCLRMYFYYAPNGRMLVIAGLRTSTEEVQEEAKGSLIVREIQADHALGRIYSLQLVGGAAPDLPPFDASSDAAFVEACRHLLGNRVYLEQQDLGTLLLDRRMKWHDPANWPGGVVPGDSSKWRSGKAFSFFKRPDGLRVGVSKMGFTTCSTDDGVTWSRPTVPPTLVTGKAKVWSQQTADGRYAMAYNPTRRSRFPLVVVSGDDGIHFSGMRVVQGELPRQRYPGLHRSVGPQYTRGLSEWSSDGSITDDALWLVYSMSKEDIWVSRVPLPLTSAAPVTATSATSHPPAITPARATVLVDDNFAKFPAGQRIAGWNSYSPRWANISVHDGQLVLTNRDPHDYAAATRIFAPSACVDVELTFTPAQADQGRFEIDLVSPAGSECAVRVTFDEHGQITATGSDFMPLGAYAAGQRMTLSIRLDCRRGRFSISINDTMKLHEAVVAVDVPTVHRVVLRTGSHRNRGGTEPIEISTDCPTRSAIYAVNALRISNVWQA